MSARPICFVDRDGTIIHEPDDLQVDTLAKVRLVDGVLPALLCIQDAGFDLVMVSNQDGLGTDAFLQADFDGAHGLVMQILTSQGVRFREVLIDPHPGGPDAPWTRKPGIGMVVHLLKDRALKGHLYDASKGTPPGVEDSSEQIGRVIDLLLAIATLTLVTVLGLLLTGIQALHKEGLDFSVLGALEHTNVGRYLVFGGLAGLLVCAIGMLQQKVAATDWLQSLVLGVKGMLPAIYILLLAWTIAALISQLETGQYLASLVQESLPLFLLPAVLFLLAGMMAFATGTSWGTFGIMLPIAADMTMAIDAQLLLPAMSAVMAGAVFGDHCSPISDTTILSSTGASCHHIDHVLTQLPYALSIAVVSLMGYVALGYSASVMMGLLAAGIAFILVLAFWHWQQRRLA